MKRMAVLMLGVCMMLSGCGVRAGLSDGLKVMERLEGAETFETVEDSEEIEVEETELNAVGLDEIEDNWPESIRYKGDGLYAQPISVTFMVEKPTTLALTCETREGKLRLKIVGKSGGEERVYYDETNPEGMYSVEIDTTGTCQALFYAEYHVGSVEITP